MEKYLPGTASLIEELDSKLSHTKDQLDLMIIIIMF